MDLGSRDDTAGAHDGAQATEERCVPALVRRWGVFRGATRAAEGHQGRIIGKVGESNTGLGGIDGITRGGSGGSTETLLVTRFCKILDTNYTRCKLKIMI
jgi:hypothetical protein